MEFPHVDSPQRRSLIEFTDSNFIDRHDEHVWIRDPDATMTHTQALESSVPEDHHDRHDRA